MSRAIRPAVLVLAAVLALLVSCNGSSDSDSEGGAGTIVIGFTASLTGKLNVESVRQKNGLELWAKDVNDAGGLALADGRVLRFATKCYDDESAQDRVQQLYTRLVTEDRADFLVSPYSSGLTSAASVIAEQNGKVMISAGAASDSNYRQGFSLVYQVYTPASHYLTGSIDLIRAAAPDAKRIAIVHENDKFSTDVCSELRSYAESKGIEVALFEGYDSGTTDFAPLINKVAQASPAGILGGGHFQDGSTLARQLAEKGIPIQFLVLLVAPPEPSFGELGDAAAGVIGPSQWEPRAAFAPGDATEGVRGCGPAAESFVAAYRAAHGEEPSYHAAGGYAAGLVLADAILRAGGVETEAVREALDRTDILTFFGRMKFDASESAHGLQIGHEMVYIQWQKNREGNLVKEVVWPREAKTAEVRHPVR
ncbi:MAG: amino acid ABC transporter substrate-binding protein [Planctomycetes bacterium]|nr:amino acid ABC transporter substrate-binding protein [Planctomycetota bacterium]